MAGHKVGGEVDSFCTRCKMTLAHTILAMVGTKIARVHCNTCGSDHAYRTEAASQRTSSPRTPREKVDKVLISFNEQLAGRDLPNAPMYSAQALYVLDQLINHPTFGYGIVKAVRQDKVDVAFKAQEKTLVHGRLAVPTSKPSFSPARPPSDGPADKPSAMAEPSPAAPTSPSASVTPRA